MSSERIRVAVVGAGIAGLTMSLALARNGLTCRVFEQASQLAEVGAGVQLAPNATRLLHRLGLRDRLRAVAVPARAIEMRRWEDNSVLLRTPLGTECEQRFGAPYYTVHRADLQRCLLERLPEGVLHLGRYCTDVREYPDGVHLRFADGFSTTADLVVGADGIHSRVRNLLIRDEPRYSGQRIYRALIAAERVPFLLTEPKVVLWVGPGRHCVGYPVSSSGQISLAATVPDPHWVEKPWVEKSWVEESWSAQGRVEDLAEAYAGWHPEVRALTTAARTVSRWALHDRDWLPRWSTDRVTVIGDAAHPMLPFLAQGANQAIEDALALAACLRDVGPAEITDALVRYEETRQPRTSEVHRISRANTAALHLPDGAEQRSRDDELAARAALVNQAWIYGYDAEAAVTDRDRAGM
ncbi:MAG: FAD-dependent monooxygenase [Pseudonocardiaceae bacterium]